MYFGHIPPQHQIINQYDLRNLDYQESLGRRNGTAFVYGCPNLTVRKSIGQEDKSYGKK